MPSRGPFIEHSRKSLATSIEWMRLPCGLLSYAVGEALRWPVGLARQPKAARAFYVTLAVATALGTAINFLPVDPIRALYWSAVINGVMAAPIIVVMMKLASDPRVMGRFTLSSWLKIVGWITAAVMAVCVVGLIASLALQQGGRSAWWGIRRMGGLARPSRQECEFFMATKPDVPAVIEPSHTGT